MHEVIEKGRSSEAHPTPLLFVHGAAHAAWCWDEYFLDFFADRGYRAVALSLHGHGASPISSQKCFSRLDGESYRVMSVDMALLHPVRHDRVKAPMLVLGARTTATST